MRPKLPAAALLTALSLLLPPAASACEDRRDPDHDLARDLYDGGKIHSLAEILRLVRQQVPGDVVSVGLDCSADRWIYRLQVVDGRGRRTIVSVDASAGAILNGGGGDD